MITFEELKKFYDNNNNKEKFNYSLSLKSGKFNLKCTKNHTWLQRMSDIKSNKITCPYCANRRLLTGFNDLKTKYPRIAAEWDYQKNTLLPEEILFKSSKKVWWICDKGHSFEKTVGSRTVLSQGCYYCSGKKVLQGYNDLQTEYPDIAHEWNYDKNPTDVQPIHVRKGSNKKYWWNCKNNHTYESTVTNRVQGYGCPYCYGRKAWKGDNDLLSKYPELVKSSWDYDKNTIKPDEITYGSDKKVWWQCSLGHSWEARIYSRKNGHECPYCTNRKVLTGFNDLKTKYPRIAAEWDYQKNKEKPEEVKASSTNKFWFNCSQGHNYQTVLAYRTMSDSGCPACAKTRSKLEIEVFNFINEITGETQVINNYSDQKISEIDIFIPSLNIGIEVNGIFWHSSKAGRKDPNVHFKKWLSCKEAGIQLITIWEDDWRNNNVLVKTMLRHKLGLSQQDKIYARNTKIVELPNKFIKSFLAIHHIQSFGLGTLNICLTHNDIPVAVSTWLVDTKNNALILDRYATSENIIGGFSKILKQGVELAQSYNLSKIITYSDHEVSHGELYKKTGFTIDGMIKPSYYYIWKNGRVHKSNFRKKRFRKDPQLQYIDGFTEKQLAELNGIHKVYDCGKTRWVYNI